MGLCGNNALHTPSYTPTGAEVAVFRTSKGEIRARLDAEGAPIHVANFYDGALAMARSQDPDSAGSQFYFCLGPQHALDLGYTVFGQTIAGLDVISRLRAGDVIESVRIEQA